MKKILRSLFVCALALSSTISAWGYSLTGKTRILSGKGEVVIDATNHTWPGYTNSVKCTDNNEKSVTSRSSTFGGTTHSLTFKATPAGGYSFAGWWDNTNGSGNEVSKDNPWETGEIKSANATYIRNAKFIPIEYKITYDEVEGASNPNPTIYTIEDAITLAAPSKTGYDFRGWSNEGKITKGSTEDKSFSASWAPINYTISYDLKGGTNAEGNPTTYTIESNDINLANPTRPGYTFGGWSNEGVIAQGSTGDKSFTAEWIPISEIKTIGNGGWSTFCCNYDYTITDGTAYSATLEDGHVSLTPFEEGTVFAAGTGVAIKAETSYSITAATGDYSTETETGLIGTIAPTAQEAGSAYYGIATKNGVTGFAKASSTLTLPAGRAFLQVVEAGAPTRLEMTILNLNNPPVATGAEEGLNKYVKSGRALINGKFYIIRDNKMFDLNGRLVK